MLSRITITIFALLSALLISAQSISHVDPPNWWTGMQHNSIQIMIHGDDISSYDEVIINHPSVSIDKITKADSPNYLFVDITIDREIAASTLAIILSNGSQKITHHYPILANDPTDIDGFTAADAIYLITPDRFANGDPNNDDIENMKEKANRSNKGGRHGGDIAGIESCLEYISDMGFTSIWLNPLLENDMEVYSYHGYSTTDFYKVDPRFGSNEEYRQMADHARDKGLKLIMDMIVNHCGSFHWWADDLPYENWYNQWPEYTGTNHQKTVMQDPYVSEYDKKQFTDGWFVPTMPDLNQRNPQMAKYLIQNSIWWVEYLGLSGIRMDTYPYPDEDFMSEWTKSMMIEYPTLNIVGEEWNESPVIVSYWQAGKVNSNGYTSNLKSVMDFPVNIALVKALNQKESWGKGLSNLYEMIAMDFLYPDPMNLVTFSDNHDMARIWALLNHDYDLWKMAITHVMTNRGIPQLYYGTEILTDSPAHRDDGAVRSDFPGGWNGDTINAITGSGLTAQQKEAQQYVKSLLQWRKSATAIHNGKMKHYRPEDGRYVYFRYNDKQTIMIVINKGEKTELDISRYTEVMHPFTSAHNVLDRSMVPLKNGIALDAKSVTIFELIK